MNSSVSQEGARASSGSIRFQSTASFPGRRASRRIASAVGGSISMALPSASSKPEEGPAPGFLIASQADLSASSRAILSLSASLLRPRRERPGLAAVFRLAGGTRRGTPRPSGPLARGSSQMTAAKRRATEPSVTRRCFHRDIVLQSPQNVARLRIIHGSADGLRLIEQEEIHPGPGGHEVEGPQGTGVVVLPPVRELVEGFVQVDTLDDLRVVARHGPLASLELSEGDHSQEFLLAVERARDASVPNRLMEDDAGFELVLSGPSREARFGVAEVDGPGSIRGLRGRSADPFFRSIHDGGRVRIVGSGSGRAI